MIRPLSWVFALCVLEGFSACSVASVPEVPSTIAQNQCTSDSDCPGGSCVGTRAGDNQCRTTNGNFETFLFEVTPPADASPIAGVQFLKSLSLSKSGQTFELPLDLVAQVTGEVTLSPRACTPKFDDDGTPLATSADSSVPALISFTPSAGALGVFASPAVAESTLPNQSSYIFSIDIPPGQYDIYVQPKNQPDDTCVVPPQLLRAQMIKGGALNLNISQPLPASFDLHVSWPLGDGALAGWVADMLDPVSGHVISNQAALTLEKGGLSYLASLSYLPVVGDTSKVKAQELVRISPPTGVHAPSILLARAALSLFSASSGTLSQFTALPTTVQVEGQITNGSLPLPVAATVTLVATKINGVDPGVLASFVSTATAGADGTFDVDLLPGTYRVDALPGDNSDLAQTSTNWVIADSPDVQAGKLIELGSTLEIDGDALDASGAALTGAQVQAVASPASIVTDVLHVSLGETVSVPRAMNGSVHGDGSFALYADSGIYDFSVRPQASTGFSWLVIPSLAVGSTPATSASAELGDLLSPLPVSYVGKVTSGDPAGATQTVPGALVRAFIYMHAGAYTADSTQADSVLQIAETRSDDEGTFELLIPATLNTPPHT
jgi:hypothetical protein